MPCITEIVLADAEGFREALRAAASTAKVTLSVKGGILNTLPDNVLSVFKSEELGVSGKSGRPVMNVFLPTPRGSSTQKVDPLPIFD